jgi:hypothetical protein
MRNGSVFLPDPFYNATAHHAFRRHFDKLVFYRTASRVDNKNVHVDFLHYYRITKIEAMLIPKTFDLKQTIRGQRVDYTRMIFNLISSSMV